MIKKHGYKGVNNEGNGGKKNTDGNNNNNNKGNGGKDNTVVDNRFPKHWGQPPKNTIGPLVKLPGGHGMGT